MQGIMALMHGKGGEHMSRKMIEGLTLSTEEMKKLKEKTRELEAQGVHAAKDHSGEMNFAGCATGYCQAWA